MMRLLQLQPLMMVMKSILHISVSLEMVVEHTKVSLRVVEHIKVCLEMVVEHITLSLVVVKHYLIHKPYKSIITILLYCKP